MIVVFGTVCLDRIRRISELPPVGGYAEIDQESWQLGGEAANTAFALTQWANSVRLVSNGIALDEEGRFVRARLASAGLTAVTAGPLPKDPKTPVCDVYVTPNGERTMFGFGFNRNEPTVDPKQLRMSPGRWFTAEPNMEVASRDAARMAQANGMNTYLMDFIRPDDPIAPGSVWQSSTDWIGQRGDVEGNLSVVKSMAERTGAFIILSDGASGLCAGSAEILPRHFPAFPAPEVVDTTGAGDVFRAAMLHGLSRSWPVLDALRFAAAAGALQCRFYGATTRVSTLEEMEALIAGHPEISAAYA